MHILAKCSCHPSPIVWPLNANSWPLLSSGRANWFAIANARLPLRFSLAGQAALALTWHMLHAASYLPHLPNLWPIHSIVYIQNSVSSCHSSNLCPN